MVIPIIPALVRLITQVNGRHSGEALPYCVQWPLITQILLNQCHNGLARPDILRQAIKFYQSFNVMLTNQLDDFKKTRFSLINHTYLAPLWVSHGNTSINRQLP
jgi:hypothetical protein